MKHASPNIPSDLDKLNPDHAAEIRRVASSNVNSTTVKGSARPMPFVDKTLKVRSETVIANRPSPIAPSTSLTTKPLNTPSPTPTHGPFASGMARAGRLGTMPSKTAPSR
jgi:hypothetical protein